MFANVAAAAILYERLYSNLEMNTKSIGHLTPRETEIFELVLDGASNPEIAEQLVLSRSTVKVHVSHILKKVGAANRMELIKKFSHPLNT